MKRQNGLFEKIISVENLTLAEQNARRGKEKQYGIKVFDKDPEGNILNLHNMLVNDEYVTSEYTTFFVYEPKERLVYRLPYFPDRIMYHAIMIHLEELFVKVFTKDSYSCIKNRGVHAMSSNIKKALKDRDNTRYCLKMDIVKFYPMVDHDIMKQLLRKIIKDYRLLALFDEIIDSADGLPIGNYLSQYFANFYLTYLDHFIKEQLKVRDYFRYADDIVIFASNKEDLHRYLYEIRLYLYHNLKLKIKKTYQVFAVKDRGVDVVGYKHFHGYTLLRPSIKKRFAKAVAKRRNGQVINAYRGWAKWCDSYHLQKKLLPDVIPI